jgi:hypothetical protein
VASPDIVEWIVAGVLLAAATALALIAYDAFTVL